MTLDDYKKFYERIVSNLDTNKLFAYNLYCRLMEIFVQDCYSADYDLHDKATILMSLQERFLPKISPTIKSNP